MDELSTIKKRREEEHKFGDVKKACEKAGVSPTIFQSALKKTRINDLTDKEMIVIKAFIEILDERKAERDALKQAMS